MANVKPTGIVRKVDELGRIVIPKELRSMFDIKERDSLEIFIDSNTIILKKYEPFCIFCGSPNSLFTYGGKNVCTSCAKKMRVFVQD